MELSETSVVEQQVEEPGEWLDEEASDLPVLAEDLFLPDPARKKFTRSEWRCERRQYATVSDTSHQLDGGASRLQTAQESDSTLDIIRKSVHNGDKQYLMEDELLYRVAERAGTGECARQLCYLEYTGRWHTEQLTQYRWQDILDGRRRRTDCSKDSSGQEYMWTFRNYAEPVQNSRE